MKSAPCQNFDDFCEVVEKHELKLSDNSSDTEGDALRTNVKIIKWNESFSNVKIIEWNESFSR